MRAEQLYTRQAATDIYLVVGVNFTLIKNHPGLVDPVPFFCHKLSTSNLCTQPLRTHRFEQLEGWKRAADQSFYATEVEKASWRPSQHALLSILGLFCVSGAALLVVLEILLPVASAPAASRRPPPTPCRLRRPAAAAACCCLSTLSLSIASTAPTAFDRLPLAAPAAAAAAAACLPSLDRFDCTNAPPTACRLRRPAAAACRPAPDRLRNPTRTGPAAVAPVLSALLVGRFHLDLGRVTVHARMYLW